MSSEFYKNKHRGYCQICDLFVYLDELDICGPCRDDLNKDKLQKFTEELKDKINKLYIDHGQYDYYEAGFDQALTEINHLVDEMYNYYTKGVK